MLKTWKEWLLMLLHVHIWEDYKTDNIVDFHNEIVGQVVITKCKICGKLKITYYYTNVSYAGRQ